MKSLVCNIINDDTFDKLTMTIITYVVPYQAEDHSLKKILLFYWEVTNKSISYLNISYTHRNFWISSHKYYYILFLFVSIFRCHAEFISYSAVSPCFFEKIIEIVNKDGRLKDEMILVCNSLRTDLLHPNEYLRGRTLRLVSRIMFKGILEPLISCILEGLSHKHTYVRRNAIIAIY